MGSCFRPLSGRYDFKWLSKMKFRLSKMKVSVPYRGDMISNGKVLPASFSRWICFRPLSGRYDFKSCPLNVCNRKAFGGTLRRKRKSAFHLHCFFPRKTYKASKIKVRRKIRPTARFYPYPCHKVSPDNVYICIHVEPLHLLHL